MSNKTFWVLVIVLVLVAGLLGYRKLFENRALESSPTEDGLGVACTLEAMQCPDGSYVGREGPNCEFAACPE